MISGNQRSTPALIFFEDHMDAKTGEFLQKILPQLKALGYDTFLDEAPADWSIADKFDYSRKLELRFERLIKDWEELGVPILELCQIESESINKTDTNSLSSSSNKSSSAENKRDRLMSALMNAYIKIKIRYADLAFEIFLHKLLEENITYKGMDIIHDGTKSLQEMGLGATRDNLMGEAFLKNISGVFGRVGLAHMPGIQERILLNLSLEQAEKEFCFINVSSTIADCAQFNSPLPIVPLDFASFTMEENIKMIIDLIEAKQKLLVSRSSLNEAQSATFFKRPDVDNSDANSPNKPPSPSSGKF